MDRRMLLAMVLFVVVLGLNSLIFGKRPAQGPVPHGPADTTQVSASKAIAPARSAMEGASLPRAAAGTMLRDPLAEAATPETVHVETDRFAAELSSVGASLVSWKLKDYTDPTEQPADLVRSRDPGALWFALHEGAKTVRTDSTRFRTRVERGPTETQVEFIADDPSGVRLRRTYRFAQGGYDCRLDIALEGVGGGAQGGTWEIGWVDGLPSLERDPRGDHSATSAIALFGKEYLHTGAGHGALGCATGGGGPKSVVREGTLRWMGVRNKYFLGALLLDSPRDRRVLTAYDPADHSASALLVEPLSLTGVTEQSYRLYLGPIHYTILASYHNDLERVQDLGPWWTRPFSKLLMRFFVALNRVVPNYGLEILILSILIRFLFYPLTKKSMGSMKRMQQLKPEMDRINAKYKGDAERRNREILDLYRKNKVNPLGGCLPVLVQLPVLSALYFVLANAVQLRKEPFGLWIHDLSAPDTVAHVAGFPLNLLPLIMAGTMVWQQKITPTDPRQATLAYIMPVFMTFLFYSTPSGLVFYWTISNLMTILQQIWMNRDSEIPIVAPAEVSSSGGRGKAR